MYLKKISLSLECIKMSFYILFNCPNLKVQKKVRYMPNTKTSPWLVSLSAVYTLEKVKNTGTEVSEAYVKLCTIVYTSYYKTKKVYLDPKKKGQM